jgi:hypothetical protein
MDDQQDDAEPTYHVYETALGTLTVYLVDAYGQPKAGTSVMVYKDSPPVTIPLKEKYRR